MKIISTARDREHAIVLRSRHERRHEPGTSAGLMRVAVGACLEVVAVVWSRMVSPTLIEP